MKFHIFQYLHKTEVRCFYLQTLKTVCFGSATMVPTPDWIRSGLTFHVPENLHAFGLKASKGSTKAFKLLCQAYILKNLMFEKKVKKAAQ